LMTLQLQRRQFDLVLIQPPRRELDEGKYCAQTTIIDKQGSLNSLGCRVKVVKVAVRSLQSLNSSPRTGRHR
jgi:hypothetical protein